jgi:hypothetical protein
MVVAGRILVILGAALFCGGMLLLTIIGVRRELERLEQPRETDTWLRQLDRAAYEPLPGWIGLLARLAVPMLAIGLVLICAGILLNGMP